MGTRKYPSIPICWARRVVHPGVDGVYHVPAGSIACDLGRNFIPRCVLLIDKGFAVDGIVYSWPITRIGQQVLHFNQMAEKLN